MSAEKKRVPKRRFKEFLNAGDWEQRKLGDCFKERLDRSANGELISVTINEGIRRFRELGRHDNSSEDKSNYKKVEIGDIAYNSMRMWQGASGYSPYSGILSPAYTVLIPKEEIDTLFFSYMFKRPRMIYTFQIRSQGITSDTWNLKFPALSEIEIACPQMLEQEWIGGLLSKFDNLITLHQRKLDKMKTLKSAYLSEMFPAEGERKPKRRFAGFTDDWEQRKLGELAYRSVKISSLKDIPRIEYEDIDSGCGTINKDLSEKHSEKTGLLFQKGDVLYGKLRPYLKNWLIAWFSGIAVGDFWVIRSNNTDSKYLYTLIQSTKFSQVTNQSIGTKMPRADWNLVSNSEFRIPLNIREQQRIGELFLSFDNLITLHQRKLEKLQNIKKAYLNEMFI